MEIQKLQKRLQLLFSILFTGQIVFALVALAVKAGGYVNIILDPDKAYMLSVVLLVFSLINLPAGHYFHDNTVKKLQELENIKQKTEKYFTSFLVKNALFDSVSVFSIAVFLLTGTYRYLLVVCIVLIFMFIGKPNMHKLESDLIPLPEPEAIDESNEETELQKSDMDNK